MKATAVVILTFAMGIVVGMAVDRIDGPDPTPLRVCVEPAPPSQTGSLLP